MVRIKKKSRSCSLFSSSDMTQRWTLRAQRLSYQNQYCAWAKKDRKETLLDDVYMEYSSIASHRIDIQGDYYFSVCVQRFKGHILASLGPGIQFSIIQEWINIFFSEWKVLNYRLQVDLQSCSDSGKGIDTIHFSSLMIQLNYTQKSLHILLVSL